MADNANEKNDEECQICGKVTLNLKRHLKIHNELKPFKCEYCEKEFKRTDHLTRHLKIHDELIFKKMISNQNRNKKQIFWNIYFKILFSLLFSYQNICIWIRLPGHSECELFKQVCRPETCIWQCLQPHQTYFRPKKMLAYCNPTVLIFSCLPLCFFCQSKSPHRRKCKKHLACHCSVMFSTKECVLGMAHSK